MISTEQYAKIKAIITDVDGVLTDCRVGYGLDELVKFFHYRDGHWIKLALRAGLIVGWLSGKSSKANRDRAAELGITFLEENVHRKIDGFGQILERYNLSADECLYIGDDLIDMPVMRRAGIAVAVADAIPELDEVAHMRTKAIGGHGAVCEVIRELLIAQGKYEAVTERYYQ
ncbi:MAG: HAD hydrolase family protein [Victivallaceae bacterium]|nr:HAD hydrolase family protein [Victivallaceae bacterium]